MRITGASFEIMRPAVLDDASRKAIYSAIEAAGRICYKTEERISEGSAEQFIRRLIERGHEAMLEHASMTVKFIVDRGVSHELVRHRIASFAQESTRYCNYAQERFNSEITVIQPCFFREDSPSYEVWKRACEACEKAYVTEIVADSVEFLSSRPQNNGQSAPAGGGYGEQGGFIPVDDEELPF